jgi:ATP-binding cassette subfamily C (CFTR/MRP) protein 1
MSVDTQKFMEVMPFLTFVWSSPIQIGISIWMLYNTLDSSVFAGLAILLLLIPLNGVVATYARKYQMEQMKLKDKRIRLTNEVLSGIKVLKLYAWETSYEQEIQSIRDKELVLLRKAAYLNSSTIFSFQCAPFLVSYYIVYNLVSIASTAFCRDELIEN